jgi:endonuclease/exonuclease/phosphatase family metal-dependent hydrolase
MKTPMSMKLKVLIALLIVCVLFSIFFYACRTQKPVVVPTKPSVEKTTPTATTLSIPLKIATFNIQNFGKSKLGKSDIMDTLVAIVRAFDIVAIQEVSDISNQTAKLFLELINQNEQIKYEMVCSERSGREKNDQSSREQYAFYYRPDLVQLVDTALYNDSEKDYFQREPFTSQFMSKKSGTTFLLSTIHTAPEFAVEEIEALIHVVNWIPLRFSNAENIIFCGDFNASCTYANPTKLDQLSIRKQPYYWIIPDTAKTNLSKNQCAYDRFIVTESLYSSIKKWEVFRYFKSKKVSDHWPVYIEIAL